MTIPFVPIADCAKVTLTFDNHGQLAENVYHVTAVGGFANDQVALLDVCSVFDSWWNGQFASSVFSDVILKKISAVDQSVQNGAGVELISDSPGTCGETAFTLPQSVTVAVKWSTGRTGRSYRGRTYHVGLKSNSISGGFIVPATQTFLKTGYDALIPLLDTAGYTLVIASRCQNKTWLVAGVTTPVQASTVNLALDTQRRRLPERGA